MEAIRILLIVIFLILVVWTLWVLFLTSINFFKTRRLFKSSFNSTWKTKMSTIIMIIFFGVSFAVIGGTINAIRRIETSMTDLTVENNLYLTSTDLNSLEDVDESFHWEWKTLFNETDNNFSPTEQEEFVMEYFDSRTEILQYFGVTFVAKLLSNVSAEKILVDLVYKYEVSYFMSTTAAPWAYQIVSLNNVKVLELIYDIYTGKIFDDNWQDDYLINTYEANSFLQSSSHINSSTVSENYFINDFQIEDELIETAMIDTNNDGIEEEVEIDGINNIFIDTGNEGDYIDIAVGADWAHYNNIEVGDTFGGPNDDKHGLPRPSGLDIPVRVVATIRMPQYIFPSFSLSKVIPDTSQQTYILMDTFSFIEYYGSEGVDSKAYMSFTNIQSSLDTYDDFISKITKSNLANQITPLNLIYQNLFINGTQKPFDSLSDQNSITVYVAFTQIIAMKVLSSILLFVFLFITIIVLVSLLKRKIRAQTVELGTLKALGWRERKIAVSFIAYPGTIILAGGTFALLFSFIVQLGWISFWNSLFLMSSGTVVMTFFSLALIFFLPIFILMSISYIVSMRLLKKPAIDLINKVDHYKPGILVKTSGLVTSRMSSFKTSYRTKQMFSSLGKSFILFTSIFFSLLVISFSLSGVNLIDNTVSVAVDAVGFEEAYTFDPYTYEKSGDIISISEAEEKYSDPYILAFDDISLELLSIEDYNSNKEIDQIVFDYLDSKTTSNLNRKSRAEIVAQEFNFNSSFNISTSYIPWQISEAIGSSIEWINQGENDNNNWYDNDLSGTGISFNNINRYYDEYVQLYNTNLALSSNSKKIVKPNIVFDQMIMSDNAASISFSNIYWNTYIDSVTKEQVDSLEDLGSTVIFSETKVLYSEDNSTWYEDKNYLYQHESRVVSEYYDYADGTQSELPKSWYEDVSSTEPIEVVDMFDINGEPISWHWEREVSVDHFNRNDFEIEDTFLNNQWLISLDEIDDIEEIINVDLTSYYDDINSYPSSEDSNYIPILIDSFNASRLNLSKGQQISFQNIDEKYGVMNNRLNIDNVDDFDPEKSEFKNFYKEGIEIVGVYESKIPLGAITLNEYILSDFNDINSNPTPSLVVDQADQQFTFASLTDDSYMPSNNIKHYFTSSSLKTSYSTTINKSAITDQIEKIVFVLKLLFIAFTLFASFIALTLIFVSIKEIANDSTTEIAILKSMGYNNRRATSLVLSPYLFIFILAILVSLPINLAFFIIISNKLSAALGGISIWLGIPIWEWLIIIFSILLLFIIIIGIVYWTFKRINPIEALNV